MLDDDLSGPCDECGMWSPCRTSVFSGGVESRVCTRCLADRLGEYDDNEYQPYDEEDDDA